MKTMIVLTAQVKYPSVNTTYLTANSYVVRRGNIEDHDKAISDFSNDVEKDGFKILNLHVYIVPSNHILSIGFFSLIANKFMRSVRCDGNAKG